MQPTPTARSLPERRPRTSFHLTVACLSVIAGLVLGVGGFFGIRALQGPDGTGEGSVDGDGTPEVLAEAVFGPEEAVAHDVVFPYEPSSSSGWVDVRFRDVDWDATDEVTQESPFNEEPAEGNKYITATLEGVHRGEAEFKTFNGRWLFFTYVDGDGVEYERGSEAPPLISDLQAQKEVAAPSDEVLSQAVFEVPETVDGEGFFVFTPKLGGAKEGTWVRAS